MTPDEELMEGLFGMMAQVLGEDAPKPVVLRNVIHVERVDNRADTPEEQ